MTFSDWWYQTGLPTQILKVTNDFNWQINAVEAANYLQFLKNKTQEGKTVWLGKQRKTDVTLAEDRNTWTWLSGRWVRAESNGEWGTGEVGMAAWIKNKLKKKQQWRSRLRRNENCPETRCTKVGLILPGYWQEAVLEQSFNSQA